MKKIVSLLMVLILLSSCNLVRRNSCSPRAKDRGVSGSWYFLDRGYGKGYKKWMRRNSEADPVRVQQRNRFGKK